MLSKVDTDKDIVRWKMNQSNFVQNVVQTDQDMVCLKVNLERIKPKISFGYNDK